MAAAAVAGQGELTHAPGWTSPLEDEFLGQVLLSSPNPLFGTEMVPYRTRHSSGPVFARAACLLPVKQG